MVTFLSNKWRENISLGYKNVGWILTSYTRGRFLKIGLLWVCMTLQSPYELTDRRVSYWNNTTRGHMCCCVAKKT